MKLRFGLIAAVMIFTFGTAAKAKEGNAFNLQSPVFTDGTNIPGVYTCEGNDISPPLSWSGVPADTKTLALIVDDPDAPDPSAPRTIWVHWVLFNISPDMTALPENVGASLPAGIQQGLNDWKTPGYRGPCPPVGRHRYFFKLYALANELPFKQPLTKEKLERAMEHQILAQATLMGTYEHGKR